MMKPYIRKEVVIIDEVREEIGKKVEHPLQKCASIAIVENVFAGTHTEDLSLYKEYGEYLGKLLLENALEALDAKPKTSRATAKRPSQASKENRNTDPPCCIWDLTLLSARF